MSLKSLTVTFFRGLCLLEMATERNRGQQASKDPRLKSVVAGKEKLGKLVLVLGGQRVNGDLALDWKEVSGGDRRDGNDRRFRSESSPCFWQHIPPLSSLTSSMEGR